MAAQKPAAWKTGFCFSFLPSCDFLGWLLLARLSEARTETGQQPNILEEKAGKKPGQRRTRYKRVACTRVVGVAHLGTRHRIAALSEESGEECGENNCEVASRPKKENNVADMSLSLLELCAGGGGQALGLELAGFHHSGVVEYEPQFCTTLRKNRPHWNVLQIDVRNLRAGDFSGVDLVATGVPCPPFSVAGKQLGADDERDMFPAALQVVENARPRAVLFENVPG